MTEIEAKYNLLEIPYYVDQKEVYNVLLSNYQHILNVKKGCSIHFYKPGEPIKNEFPEKPWYPRKIEKLKESASELSQFVESLKTTVEELDKLSKELLESDYPLKGIMERFSTEAKDKRTVLQSQRVINKFLMLKDDLWHHLPKANPDLLLSSWEIKENEHPFEKFKSEGKPFALSGRSSYGMIGRNSIHLPLIIDENQEAIVYTGFLLMSRTGRGSLDIWKKENQSWEIIHSRPTWRS